jgi:hypothetical protein
MLMRLSVWLQSFDGGVKGFAALIGVHFTNVYRYIAGARMPRPGVMQRIAAATNGAVTAADFYETPAPLPSAPGLRASSPSGPQAVTAGGRAAAGGDAAKRKRHRSQASKKAWRSRKRRAAARAAAGEAWP